MEKKFKDTKIGGWLKKTAPHILDMVGDVLPEAGALGIIKNLIQKDDKLSDEQKVDALKEIELDLQAFELEAKDRDSARNREIEITKTGSKDIMMLCTGAVGLLSFLFTIYAVVFIPSVRENELFIHLMGMIEGVVVGNIFAYYYGASVK